MGLNSETSLLEDIIDTPSARRYDPRYMRPEQLARRIPNWEPPTYRTKFIPWLRAHQHAPELSGDAPLEIESAYMTEHGADLDSVLYLVYCARCEERREAGLPEQHPAPSYRRQVWYKLMYIRSAAEFACAIQRPAKLAYDADEYDREQRAKKQNQRTVERERRHLDKVRERIATENATAKAEHEHKVRAIKRWHKAGWSRNKMAKKMGGDRNAALALIRIVVGESGI